MEKLTPYFTDDDYAELTLHIQERLDQLEQLPQPQIKEAMFDLLASIDMMHREALTRLLLLIQEQAPDLLADLTQDTIIKSVLELYEFIPMETAASPPAAGNAVFIPVDQIGVSPALKKPVWIPGGRLDDLPPGDLRAQKFEDVELVLCRVEDDLYALPNACLDSILPLSSGRLEGHILLCPWHGCRYDVRTGEIQNGSGLKLKTFPVQIGAEGRFSVGFNIR